MFVASALPPHARLQFCLRIEPLAQRSLLNHPVGSHAKGGIHARYLKDPRRHLPDHMLGMLHLLRRACHRARGHGRRFRAQSRPSLFQGRLLHQRHPWRARHYLRPTRLLYPDAPHGRRGEGRWGGISWDEALDEMADRLAQVRQKYGPEAIVGATSGAYFSRSVILALTLRSIGSPNWMINQDLCGGCRAVSARIMGLDITRGEDIDNTRCALIVGRNSHRRPGRVGGAQGRQEARRAHDRHRPQAHAGCAVGRHLARPAGRHRRRAGARHDPRADHRGALRQGVRRPLLPRLR